MSLDNAKLLDFLGEMDKELSRRIAVVAVGGGHCNDACECKTIHDRH